MIHRWDLLEILSLDKLAIEKKRVDHFYIKKEINPHYIILLYIFWSFGRYGMYTYNMHSKMDIVF